MRSLNKRVLTHIFINLNILLLFYLFYLFCNNNNLISNPEKAMNLSKLLVFLSFIIILYYFILWGDLVKSRINFLSMFLISFYLFTLGQPLLNALNFTPTVNLFEREPIESIVVAQFYTIICLVSFYIGSLLTLIKNKKENIPKKTANYLFVFRNIGVLLFFVALPFTLYYLVVRYNYTINLGYGAFYNDRESGSFLFRLSGLMSTYFFMSLLLLMIGYKNNKNKYKAINLIVIFFVISLFIIGERATPTGILVILFWYNTNILKTTSLKGNLKMLILVLVLLFIYPIIGEIRNQEDRDLSNVTQGDENFIVESIGTFGYSMFPLIKTMEIIPENESYHYGSSYLYSLTTIIPNISNGVHIGAQKASLGEWLKNKLEMTSGPGYSMPAEAYYNFGWFLTPIMMLFGSIFAVFLTLRKKDYENSIKLFIVFAFFYMNITAPRSQFIGMVRDLFYIILPIYLILIVYKNKVINMKLKMNDE